MKGLQLKPLVSPKDGHLLRVIARQHLGLKRRKCRHLHLSQLVIAVGGAVGHATFTRLVSDLPQPRDPALPRAPAWQARQTLKE